MTSGQNLLLQVLRQSTQPSRDADMQFKNPIFKIAPSIGSSVHHEAIAVRLQRLGSCLSAVHV